MSGSGLSLRVYLDEISSRLTRAAAIAKGAVACAAGGSEGEAVRIVMDLDELLHDTQTLHGAMRLVGRMQRRAEEAANPG